MESVIHTQKVAAPSRITKDAYNVLVVTLSKITPALNVHKIVRSAPIAHNAHNAIIFIAISRMEPAFFARQIVFSVWMNGRAFFAI
jgi:hypothetical protein